MNRTKIEYLTHTWNPIAMRCTPISEGCQNCWHLRMCDRLKNNPKLPMKARDAWAGGLPWLNRSEMVAPLRREKPSIIGVEFMGDLGHRILPSEWREHVFGAMALAPQHTFLVLTKRPRAFLSEFPKSAAWPRNVWFGITAENQECYDERSLSASEIPAAVRFVSIEPMLGEIYLEPWPDWVIAGCESGPQRRQTYIDWLRALRDQCVGAGIPFFLKQAETRRQGPDRSLGSHVISMPKLDGQVWNHSP